MRTSRNSRQPTGFPWVLRLSVFVTLFLTAGGVASARDAISIRRVDTPPAIDGVFGANEWSGAAKTELAYQKEPQENDKPTERTDVYLAYDRENLYFAFYAFDSNPAAIRAPISKRDNVTLDDFVSIWLDTYDDRRRTYAFRFNPLGVQEDGIFTPGDTGNLSWDGVLDSKGALTPEGYVVEIRIPFKTLRYQINEKKTWGLHLFRWIARKQERSTWARTSLANVNLFSQMGTLEGIDDIFSGRTLDVIPTLTLSNDGERELQNGIPRFSTVNRVVAGVTVNYSITPNLTLAATVNPDFSQVENDVPQVTVNQRFPLFFPERRPFFLEGAEVFRSVYVGAPQLIDTRQIVDPDWGVKLTGKIGRNSIGLLSASDNAAGLRLSPNERDYGKNAQFNIARYSRDILKNSNVGFSFTDRRFAGSSNTVATADGRFQIDDSNLFAIQASYSRTRDAARNSHSGYAIYAAYNFDNLNWENGLSLSTIHDGFAAQSGFVRRTGIKRGYAYSYRIIRPKEKTWWNRFRAFLVTTGTLDRRNNLDEAFFDPGIAVDLSNGVSVYTYFSIRRDSFLGRGYTTAAYNGNIDVTTFKRISLSNNFEIGTGVNFDPSMAEKGRMLNNQLTVTVRPVKQISSEFLWIKTSLSSANDGAGLFSQDLFRNRTVYQFDRFNSVRSIIDYDTSARSLGLSFLYAFTPSPNKAIYVGYADLFYNGIEPLDGTRRNDLIRQRRGIFAKFSYSFRF